MRLLTDRLRARLRANAVAHRARGDGFGAGREAGLDPAPVVKFFNPMGVATWLATELDADDDTLFGLADLGFGCPELGYFSLGEIARLRLPFGLGIERDLNFETIVSLSRWAGTARRMGSILAAERLLARVPGSENADPGDSRSDPDPELPPR